MDENTAIVLVLALLALVAVAFFMVFRHRGKLKMQGPFNTGLEMDGSNEPAAPGPGVRADDLSSEEGGLTARDESGRGVDVKRVRTKNDINLTTSSPEGRDPPKA